MTSDSNVSSNSNDAPTTPSRLQNDSNINSNGSNNDSHNTNIDYNRNPYASLQDSMEDSDDDDVMPPLISPDAIQSEEVEDSDNDDDIDDDDSNNDDDDSNNDDDDNDNDDDENFEHQTNADFLRLIFDPPLRDNFDGEGCDHDEDGDDDDDCFCPRCSVQRFLRGGSFRHSESRNSNHNTPPENQSLLNESETSGNADPDSPTCAVCLEHESSTRRLVNLPCCGTTNMADDQSSTRFCHACLTKYLRTKAVRDRYDCAIGECPRCRRLLAAEGDVDCDWEVQTASTSQMLRYIMMQPQHFHMYVITVAWAYHDNVSVELLALKQNDAMSQECVARLVQWGLLEKKSSNVYCVDTQLQRELRFLCMTQVKANLEGDLEYTPPSADSDDDDGDHISNSSVRSQCFMVAVNMAGGLWTLVKQFQFHRTPRLANRVATLLLLAGGLVPIAADWKQSRTSSYSLTALNLVCLYLLGKILGHVVYVVLYAGVGMTLALLTGFWLHAPPLQSSARLGRNCATTALVVACIGYCVFWDDRGSAVRRGIGRSEL